MKAKQPIPQAKDLRRILKLDHTADTIPDTDVWLDTWLTGRKTIRPGTRRSYHGHIELHLKPVVTGVRLDKLRTAHVTAIFDAIEERNDLITTLRTSRDPAKRDQVKGLRTVGPATMHRIRATLRVALNGAIIAGWIDTNPAKLIELPAAKTTESPRLDRRTVPALARHREGALHGDGVDTRPDRCVPRPRPSRQRPALRPVPPGRAPWTAPG
jgi:hypothetical protein